MQRRHLLRAAAGLTLAAPLAAKAQQQFVFRCHSFSSPTALDHTLHLDRWAERVAQRSQNRIKVEMYPAMQLGGQPRDLPQQLEDGVVDMIWTVPGFTPGRFMGTEGLELPFMNTGRSATQSPAAFEFAEKNLADTEYRGMKIISMHTTDRALIHTSRRPVRTLEDFRGLRLRVAGRTPTGFGLTWTLGDESAESPTNQAPQIHTQGQPENNQSWFPAHDFPNERLTTEMVVTVEDGFVVGSNGRLVSTRLGTPGAGGRARTTWHWVQSRPHPAYLVTLTIGKFAVVGLPMEPGVPEPQNADGEPIPMYLLTPIGTEETAAAVYRDTPRMMRFFAEYFDEPYPWEKYAQVIVRNFAFGGMENTSASTMNEGTATARPGSEDDLIAHELIHQWTGNLITCRSWEHAWLNEGWASFGEALWREHRAGPDPARMRRAYQQRIAGFVGQQRGLNRTYAPLFPALVSNRYNQPLDVFMKPNDIYSKGAVVLHMLRMKLGDEVFLRGVRLYIDRFRFSEVETDDFRRVMEEVSGRSLDRFFTQWCTRPGLPRLAAELEWTPAGALPDGPGTLTIRVEQTQRIDAFNPAFAFDLPVEVRLPDGQRRTLTLPIDSRQHQLTFDLPGKPRDVVFDPRLTVIAPTSIRKPLAMWLEQIADDSSLFAQLQAVEHLSHEQDSAAEAALARAVEDPGSCNVLRSAASAGLAHRYRGRIADLWDRARGAGTRAAPEARRLGGWLRAEEAAGKAIYPPRGTRLAALERTPLDAVKVVILGQDPYHGPGQAMGLSFSVPRGVPPPPSLGNIYKELASDLGLDRPAHGDLTGWARQGVLLLNNSLTVEANRAGSHAGRGWDALTDACVRAVAERAEPSVFVLWGSHAQGKAARIPQIVAGGRHLVLASPHPSPLSAHRGFFGSRPFSRANAFLEAHGRGAIDWRL
ncbi:uracil-DNA glycosylase [Leptolyngbya sp. 15MV]|nr:uracil-DNA glycosylase [Leptolyngbya sp. 15MV]